MNILCGLVAIGLIVSFTAVNLFFPYAILVLSVGIGLASFLGIPFDFLTPDRKRECRLGYC